MTPIQSSGDERSAKGALTPDWLESFASIKTQKAVNVFNTVQRETLVIIIP